MGLIFLLVTSSVVAAACHGCMRRYLLASVVSAILSITIFVFFAYLDLGYLDPFIVVAVVLGGCYVLLVSLVVGVPFVLYRRRRRPIPGHCRACDYNLTGNVSGVCPECGTACVSAGLPDDG